MKVIAIPDLHIGKTFNVTYGDPAIWEARSLKLVKNILKREQPDKVVFLGDIFNTSSPSFHHIFKFMFEVKDYDVSVISGNHDIPKTKKKSVMDYLSKYVHVIFNNDIDQVYPDSYAIAWCDTQSRFEAKLKATLKHTKGNVIFLHAAYNNWDNEMDNVVTDELINLAKEKDIKLISGHEHIHNIQKDTLYHLGSISPMNIGELGPKYYWSSVDGLVKINHKVGKGLSNDIILTDEDPGPQGKKPVYVKAGVNSVNTDLVMEERELTIDVLADFTTKAIAEGFDKDFIKDFFD